MSARYIVADVFDGLATLEDDSVDLIFSSPPFLALRSYLPADHPEKAKEIGSEATPADFLDTLLDVVEACDRVLAPHGSLCFELGDTFAGGYPGETSPSTGDNHSGGERIQDRRRIAYGYQNKLRESHAAEKGWPQPKSLCLIPTLFAASLAYGYNMLRPDRKTPRWRVRNLVVWARPNPPVGALGDKFRPATSYVTVATKSKSRYFDLDAVREPHKESPGNVYGHGDGIGGRLGPDGRPGAMRADDQPNPAGAPPLDYWVIPTEPFKGAHYATFPRGLVVKPIASMCPQRVCRVCGEPSRRIVEAERSDEPRSAAYQNGRERAGGAFDRVGETTYETLGWSDCGCALKEREPNYGDFWRPGCVLDPFAGSGTTLAVATGHGRDAIGIDLDSRNADLALERVGPMFLTVEVLSDCDDLSA